MPRLAGLKAEEYAYIVKIATGLSIQLQRILFSHIGWIAVCLLTMTQMLTTLFSMLIQMQQSCSCQAIVLQWLRHHSMQIYLQAAQHFLLINYLTYWSIMPSLYPKQCKQAYQYRCVCFRVSVHSVSNFLLRLLQLITRAFDYCNEHKQACISSTMIIPTKTCCKMTCIIKIIQTWKWAWFILL